MILAFASYLRSTVILPCKVWVPRSPKVNKVNRAHLKVIFLSVEIEAQTVIVLDLQRKLIQYIHSSTGNSVYYAYSTIDGRPAYWQSLT